MREKARACRAVVAPHGPGRWCRRGTKSTNNVGLRLGMEVSDSESAAQLDFTGTD